MGPSIWKITNLVGEKHGFSGFLPWNFSLPPVFGCCFFSTKWCACSHHHHHHLLHPQGAYATPKLVHVLYLCPQKKTIWQCVYSWIYVCTAKKTLILTLNTFNVFVNIHLHICLRSKKKQTHYSSTSHGSGVFLIDFRSFGWTTSDPTGQHGFVWWTKFGFGSSVTHGGWDETVRPYPFLNFCFKSVFFWIVNTMKNEIGRSWWGGGWPCIYVYIYISVCIM